MLEAPVEIPAACELRRNFDQEIHQCTVRREHKGDTVIIEFRLPTGNLMFGGYVRDGVMYIIAASVDGSEPMRLDGVCLSDEPRRRIACAWTIQSEYTILAQY